MVRGRCIHLSQVFGQLGITSRSQLRKLAQDSAAPPPA
jgi:hypothetical protein